MTLLPHLHVKFESPTVMLQKAVERKGNVSFKQYEYEKRNKKSNLGCFDGFH